MKHSRRQNEAEPVKPDNARRGQGGFANVVSERKGCNGLGGSGERTAPPGCSPAGAERIAADARTPESSAPHMVIRGAKSEEGRTCGVDWFRVAGPFSPGRLHQIVNLLTTFYGSPESTKGRWFFDQGMKWKNSILLLWSEPTSENDTGGLCVDLPGDALNSLSIGDMLRLMFRLLNGNHCTRIDLREDHRADRVGLIDAVKASCHAGELCKARRWEPREPRTNRGELTGHGVTIGQRGKNGSGRYVRIYDKGLETGESPAGTWERLEVEFTESVATQVALSIGELGAPANDWPGQRLESELAKRIREFIYGAVDFRVNNGSRSLNERPRAAWWQKIIDGIHAVTVKQERVKTTLESFAVWVRRCVAPAIYDMAKASRQDVGDVVKFLVGNEVRGKPNPANRPIVKEFLELVPTLT